MCGADSSCGRKRLSHWKRVDEDTVFGEEPAIADNDLFAIQPSDNASSWRVVERLGFSLWQTDCVGSPQDGCSERMLATSFRDRCSVEHGLFCGVPDRANLANVGGPDRHRPGLVKCDGIDLHSVSR
jgi:hypothetical protein